MDLLEIFGWVWTNGLVIPMTNFLVLLSALSFGSFGVGIIIFTLIARGITWPLTQQQLRSSRAMQGMQPRIQELQKKYKDPRRRSEEQMKLYKEMGINPLGCVWPMLVQFPIWIALFQSIRFTLGSTPENLVDLSQRLYPWAVLRTSVPLENNFLGLDMGANSPLLMAVLVGGSMWVQQRMMMPTNPAADSQQQSMNNMMLWMMPLMFGYFTLSFPGGLALYWVATNIVSVGLQYLYMGRNSDFSWRRIFSFGPTAAPAPAAQSVEQKASAAQDNGDKEDEQEGEKAEVGAERVRRRRRRRRRGRHRRS